MATAHYATQAIVSVAYDGTNSAQIVGLLPATPTVHIVSESGGVLVLRIDNGAGDPDLSITSGQIVVINGSQLIPMDPLVFASRWRVLGDV